MEYGLNGYIPSNEYNFFLRLEFDGHLGRKQKP
jgi:hypothetical protein